MVTVSGLLLFISYIFVFAENFAIAQKRNAALRIISQCGTRLHLELAIIELIIIEFIPSMISGGTSLRPHSSTGGSSRTP